MLLEGKLPPTTKIIKVFEESRKCESNNILICLNGILFPTKLEPIKTRKLIIPCLYQRCKIGKHDMDFII